MLYPHNREAKLSGEVFRRPGSEYRGVPFWAWNCALEEPELLRQLDVFKEMGLGGAHLHVRTGMETPYLSDEHMALVRACVDKCRSEGLRAWLYDEDRWPSGAAGGLLTRHPQYRARRLRFTAGTPDEHDGAHSGARRLIACYDVTLDKDGCLQSAPRVSQDAEASGVKWYAYIESPETGPWYNNQTYANTLDGEAIREFINITHERYLEAIGDDFGGVVPAIFTDEPQFPRKGTLGFAADTKDVLLPWSDDVPDTFLAAYGEDLLAALPELFWELPGGQVSRIRYLYHDHIAERFASAFVDQCGAWCARHGLMLTGHLMEEPTLKSQTAALGEAMRHYRGFYLPGIDMLSFRTEFTTAKQAQSAAHQYGREGVLSELYGVTGWDFDFRGHKLLGDWQAALGVTVRVQHLSWVSMKGEAKRDYPASINYQSPWWQDYAYVEDHFARLNTALTRGKPLVRVGVIHPVESYWLHWGPAEQTDGARTQLDERFRDLTDWLLIGGIDFDFICESLLPDLCAQGGAPLQVGEMGYDAIVVPACETLRATTLERLEAFHSSGGRLLFLGGAPEYVDARPDSRGKALYDLAGRADFSREAVLNALEDLRLIDIRNQNGTRSDDFVHQLRQDGDALWLFIAHGRPPYNRDIPVRKDIRVAVRGAYRVQVYDTLTGSVFAADSVCRTGQTLINASLYDEDSLLLKLHNEEEEAPALPQTPDGEWRVLPCQDLVPYTLSEPNALLLDKAEVALDDGAYAPEEELLRADNRLRATLGWPLRKKEVAQPWTLEPETPTHTARLRFTVQVRDAARDVRLALEDAPQATILLDGRAIREKPDGFYVDHCIQTVRLGDLQPGPHTIEVSLPFGRRTNIEWCYLLGNFGVDLMGAARTITRLPEHLGFDDITRQGFPHYGGNLSYHLPFTAQGGTMRLTVPHYDGTALRIALDGRMLGHLAYAPYEMLFEAAAGAHELRITLLGNRQNAFGPMHAADDRDRWGGANTWRKTGARWTDSYRLSRLGLRSAPVLEELCG